MMFRSYFLLVFLSLLLADRSCAAGEFPFESWTGSLGSERVVASFDVVRDRNSAKLSLSVVSRDRLLCKMTENTYEGSARIAKGKAVRIKLKLSDGFEATIPIKSSEVSEGGIRYTQISGEIIRDGQRTPLMLRHISDEQYRDTIFGCGDIHGWEDTKESLVDVIPGSLQILLKPSLQPSFETAMADAALTWKKVEPGDGERVDNLFEIAGIPYGEEGELGKRLLKKDFTLDVRRIDRPKDGSWFGTFNGKRVQYVGRRLEPAERCPDHQPSATYFPILIAQEAANHYSVVVEDNSGKLSERHVSSKDLVERGIPVEQIELSDLILDGNAQGKLVLRRPLDESGLWITRCNELPAGWEPGILDVAIYPDDDETARKYFIQRRIEAGGGSRNIYTLTVPVGAEIDELLELRKQSWVVDVWQRGAGAGLAPLPVIFPARSLYQSVNDQEALRVKLRTALQDAFANYPINDAMVAVDGSGLNYAFTIEAPMPLLGNSAFKGYWIKTKFLFRFNREMMFDNESGVRDSMLITAPDAWLARWPSPSTPPPAGHYDHLGPNGTDRFKNYETLTWLQDVIVNRLRMKWAGLQ